MVKRFLASLFPLILPTIIVVTPLLTMGSPASAEDDDEAYFEELELPRSRKAYDEPRWKKSRKSSTNKRKRAVEEEKDDEDEDQDEEEHSLLHQVLWYLPNRLLDVADIARARVRIGPGVALNAHVTKVVQAGLGSYMSLYAGLPGPRQKRSPRLPVGVEAYSGGALSVAEASFETGYEPEYSPTEVGAGIHFILLGVDVGVDPLEVVDLLTGIVGVDIVKDDY